MSDRVKAAETDSEPGAPDTAQLQRLLARPLDRGARSRRGERIDGVIVGTLVALLDSSTALVTYPNQPDTAAQHARAAVDLQPEQIGHDVTLAFENGDPWKPIVTGWIRTAAAWPAKERPAQVDVDADGKRLTVTARDRLVLKCGQASITLTAAGKVLVQGAYVSTRSSGVLRIKGGAVQIN